jgi:hypothetical protein
MPCKCARKNWFCFYFFWASMVLIFVMACQKKVINTNRDDEQCMEIGPPSTSFSLKRSSVGCSENKAHQPLLSAHYLQQSLNQEICFEDVVYNSTSALNCAPGPFFIEGGSVIDVQENMWELSATPDYLVWHLEQKNLEESFYITNRQGFPIRSQSIKLQNDHDATLVLLPKNELVPGVKYYIYLIVNTAQETQKTWIQPITISAENKSF